MQSVTDRSAKASRLGNATGLAVIVDLLGGPAATAALTHAAHGVRLIQMGRLASVHMPVAAPLVRSHAVDIRGHAVFHVPPRVSSPSVPNRSASTTSSINLRPASVRL